MSTSKNPTVVAATVGQKGGMKNARNFNLMWKWAIAQ